MCYTQAALCALTDHKFNILGHILEKTMGKRGKKTQAGVADAGADEVIITELNRCERSLSFYPTPPEQQSGYRIDARVRLIRRVCAFMHPCS